MIVIITPGCTGASTRVPKFCIEHDGKPIKFLSVLFGEAAPFAAGLKMALAIRGETENEVVAWTGDGATFDIGLGAVSGAAERNEDIIYVCYDNEGYQNTGNQRSSATPWKAGSSTTPPPASKSEFKKDIMRIIMGHDVPYAATLSIAFPDDLMRKVRKAKDIPGFRFFHLLSPCPTGWQFPTKRTVELARLAVDTKISPLFEFEDGIVTINREPEGIAIDEYIKAQRRYKHLTPEEVAEFQKMVDKRWEILNWISKFPRNPSA